jgi:hypothetical protein
VREREGGREGERERERESARTHTHTHTLTELDKRNDINEASICHMRA